MSVLVLLNSCDSEDNTAEPFATSAVEFSPSGHLLYGYKHGIKIYGQYMDQAGDDNATILIFVEKDVGGSSEVFCKSVTINDVQVSTIIKTETVTPMITAIEIRVSSAEIEVDCLHRESQATVDFEILDSGNGTIIDKTQPIAFPCN